MINLQWATTTNPGYDGWYWYVPGGDVFEVDMYAEAYDLNRCDINPDSIRAVQDAAGHLNRGEWIQVTHTRDPE